MSQNNVIPAQKINDAAGNNTALREILQSMANTSNLQTNATNTASGKNVPPQAKATVSYLKGNYEIQIINPGGVSPTSSLQAAQAASIATQSTNIAPVVTIYHQIRVATSPTFNISSSVQTYGGDTGSAQTYWTLTGLGTGRYYFQVRSSYDGVNWNLWRNANGGQSITKGPSGVTVEQTTNGVFALFTLPGDQLVAFGAGFGPSGSNFGVPTELYTSAMQSIAGPNEFTFQPSNLAHGIISDAVAIQVPSPEPATTGPPDFPAAITMQYEDGEDHIWAGSANVFAFCYDPLGDNVTEETTADGIWVDIILPGGAHLSIGIGVTNDGVDIALPSTMPWVSGSRMLSIVSPAYGFNSAAQARGIVNAALGGTDGTTMNCGFADTTDHRWSSTGNWFAISWSPGLSVTTVADGAWLIITTPSGTKIAIGAGNGANGSTIGLPAGFTIAQMLSIATPAGADETSHPMSGVNRCDINTTTGEPVLELQYTDTQGNYWNGAVNWMAFAWQ